MDNKEKFNILIVDDEKTNLLILTKILSPKYTVFTARSGEEALERITDIEPDLILLDIMLPDISGFDILRQLKVDTATRSIPVIVISGLTSEFDEEKGLLMGAVDYIAKPFKTAIVLARVNTHLQIVRQMRMIERLGLVDPLTDIPNRRCFDDRVSLEWRRSQRVGSPLALLMLDVDKFKDYNDTWGHPQGDVLLKTVARVFASAARRSGDIAARIGGEEFSVLLTDITLEAAVYVAEDIRSKVEGLVIPTADGTVETTITVSIGVGCCVPDPDSQIADFINETDKKLYRAKEMGRNLVCSSL
jgi:diguanylate cyclase (GGDEF)-like protein